MTRLSFLPLGADKGISTLAAILAAVLAVMSRGIVLLASLATLSIQALWAADVQTDFGLDDAPAGDYLLDKTHGYITFSYLHQGYSRPWLRFRDIDSTLTIDANDITNSALEVRINAASIDSGVDIFDEHLRGEQFFNVAKHPEIKFVASSIAVEGEQLSISGELTMLETTKAVTLQGVFNKGGLHFRTKQPMLGFSAKLTLLRSEWGLGKYAPVVGDEVDVVIEVEYVQSAS